MNNLKDVIICSGSFVNDGLINYFGEIPPAFLPIKGKLLIEFQLDSLKVENFKEIYLTIPEIFKNDFRLKKIEKKYTYLKIFFTNHKNDLLLSLINIIQEYKINSSIVIMGDTFFKKIPHAHKYDKNIFSLNKSIKSFSWNKRDNKILSGFFYFNDLNKLELFKFNSFKMFLDSLIHENNNDLRFIDNLNWIDLGHFSNYIDNKFKFTTEREFNDLINNNGFFEKSSKKLNKITGEYLWFRNINEELLQHVPKVFGYKNDGLNASYKIEKIHLPTLSEVYVFGNLNNQYLKNILDKCLNLIDLMRSEKTLNSIPFWEGIKSKTLDRLKSINFNLDDKIYLNDYPGISINEILFSINTDIHEDTSSSVIHGDYCFSNLFYNNISENIIMIDPRGINLNDEITNYGNSLYDYGKLYHSVIGYYDHLVAGFYNINVDGNRILFEILKNDNSEIIKYLRKRLNEFDKHLIKLNIHLFLSMIPLHSESKIKQSAFLANAVRIYYQYHEI
uniref:hypothetical protein n=1 Tax=Flavobacterium sp. TaxID=239 RepID=UPI00404BA062